MNHIVIVGRVAQLPVTIETNTGTKLAKLVVEVERNFRNNDGAYDCDLFQVTLWRGVADSVTNVCQIHDNIAIKGRMQGTTYVNKDGHDAYAIELIAENVSFMNS